MKRLIPALLLVCLPIMGATSDCEPESKAPGGTGGGPNTANADDGEHTVSRFGKWKYGTTVGPSTARFPQCRWTLSGLQRDGWQVLYSGTSTNSVKLPAEGVYKAVVLESKSCGKWSTK